MNMTKRRADALWGAIVRGRDEYETELSDLENDFSDYDPADRPEWVVKEMTELQERVRLMDEASTVFYRRYLA